MQNPMHSSIQGLPCNAMGADGFAFGGTVLQATWPPMSAGGAGGGIASQAHVQAPGHRSSWDAGSTRTTMPSGGNCSTGQASFTPSTLPSRSTTTTFAPSSSPAPRPAAVQSPAAFIMPAAQRAASAPASVPERGPGALHMQRAPDTPRVPRAPSTPHINMRAAPGTPHQSFAPGTQGLQRTAPVTPHLSFAPGTPGMRGMPGTPQPWLPGVPRTPHTRRTPAGRQMQAAVGPTSPSGQIRFARIPGTPPRGAPGTHYTPGQVIGRMPLGARVHMGANPGMPGTPRGAPGAPGMAPAPSTPGIPRSPTDVLLAQRRAFEAAGGHAGTTPMGRVGAAPSTPLAAFALADLSTVRAPQPSTPRWLLSYAPLSPVRSRSRSPHRSFLGRAQPSSPSLRPADIFVSVPEPRTAEEEEADLSKAISLSMAADSAATETADSANGNGACCVCLDAGASHVIVPCGHQCVCGSCVRGLTSCPVCRGPIHQSIRVFASGVVDKPKQDTTDKEETKEKDAKQKKKKKDKKEKKKKKHKKAEIVESDSSSSVDIIGSTAAPSGAARAQPSRINGQSAVGVNSQSSQTAVVVVEDETAADGATQPRVRQLLAEAFLQGCHVCKSELAPLVYSPIKSTWTVKCSGPKKHTFDFFSDEWMPEGKRQKLVRENKEQASSKTAASSSQCPAPSDEDKKPNA
eukprot:TRINITY_DN51434_c0_g1_i1.p1 TRINITY_DN51434_c0_g1~~TRINITY_DN51434_c0_g1_i1.p1  ORF type:complete len:784 (+),score=64.15 TRINITY_DN51434_c0_g1_i1:297-2354(+)